MLKCFQFWYKYNFEGKKQFIYIFAYNEQQAQHIFDATFSLMAEVCEKPILYKEEKDFILKHLAREIWGGSMLIC